MLIYQNNIDDEIVRLESNLYAVDFVDPTLHAYAEKISSNYLYILKHECVKGLPNQNGISLRELRILACISAYSEPISPVSIAQILSYDPATVSRSIKILETKHKVERLKNRLDTRGIFVKLTDDGVILANAFVVRIAKAFTEIEKQLPEVLSKEEKKMFLEISNKITERSEAMRQICFDKQILERNSNF